MSAERDPRARSEPAASCLRRADPAHAHRAHRVISNTPPGRVQGQPTRNRTLTVGLVGGITVSVGLFVALGLLFSTRKDLVRLRQESVNSTALLRSKSTALERTERESGISKQCAAEANRRADAAERNGSTAASSSEDNKALASALQRERNEAWQELRAANAEIGKLRHELAELRKQIPPDTGDDSQSRARTILVDCGYCQGKGWFYGVLNGPRGNEDLQKCPYCLGTGKVRSDHPYAGATKEGRRYCEMCLGRKQLIVNGVTTPCEFCDGTGFRDRRP